MQAAPTKYSHICHLFSLFPTASALEILASEEQRIQHFQQYHRPLELLLVHRDSLNNGSI